MSQNGDADNIMNMDELDDEIKKLRSEIDTNINYYFKNDEEKLLKMFKADIEKKNRIS